jgi:hypothetical protein
MPPGLPHAVFSVGMEGYKPTCAILSGSHFISEYSMSLMLEAAISHSIWHDVWTNAMHDDVIIHVDWMLHNLLLRSSSGIPSRILRDHNAFALVTYGRFAPWLRSLPHQSHVDNPTWLREFGPLDDLHARLSENSSTQAATRRTLDILNRLARKADVCISSFPPSDRLAFEKFWEASQQKHRREIQRRMDYNMAVSNDN